MPEVSSADWSLRIDGLVDNPITITFADLMDAASEAEVTVVKTMRCIIDSTFIPGLIGTATWTGVPLRRFLDQAGVDLGQTQRFRLYASDNFNNNIRRDEVYGEVPLGGFEPMLVYAMNGEPLTPEHGFPVRLLVHNLYGYKNLKWIERIEASASDEVFGTYQDAFGFTDDAEVRVINKITNPLGGQNIPAGDFRVFGYALSGADGIERVEVSIDDGPFEAARIVPLGEVIAANPGLRNALQFANTDRFSYPFRNVWALWEFDWNATPGPHTLRLRATDRAGNTQEPTDFDPTDGNNPQFVINVTAA